MAKNGMQQHEPKIFGAPPPVADTLDPEEVARGMAAFNSMARSHETLLRENGSLRNALAVANSHIRELEHAIDHERTYKERFQRYCTQFECGVDAIWRATQALHETAATIATQEPKQIEKPDAKPAPQLSQVEQDIKDTVAGLKAHD